MVSLVSSAQNQIFYANELNDELRAFSTALGVEDGNPKARETGRCRAPWFLAS